jgi:diguanylate cyclase (GGDEF)-like protein
MTDPPPAVPEAFVSAWLDAINGTCFVSMTMDEKVALLRGLAGRLVTALHSEPFDPRPAYRIGTDMVAAGFDAPEAVGRTVALIMTRLPAGGQGGDEDLTGRVGALVEAFATGCTRAVRDRTFDAQEQIRAAAMIARLNAERELRDSEARFRHAALHDPLTGLPNRTRLTERLAELAAPAADGARVGLCVVELDGFPAVNYSLGPHAGDDLLTAVAGRLRQHLAEHGHLLARLGGGRFVILVEATTCTDDARKVADGALGALDEPFRLGGVDLPVTAKAGVVEQPLTGTDPTDLIRAADMALDWARSDGTSRWAVFEPERNARAVARYRLSAQLPGALARGEFELAYQPVVRLADHGLDGFEALARWRHPRLGLLGPDEFIRLAENTGLIQQLGMQLLESACRHAMAWRRLDTGSPYVSVNLSVHQLRHTRLVGDVAAVLDRTGLPPEGLRLEVTESTVIQPDDEADEDAVTALRALADLGIGIMIDDFGTGYSNLVYLPTLPVSGLKLDRAFLAGSRGRAVPRRTGDAFLARLVSLGHTLGLTVTAEGVETADQVRRLHLAGCDLAQGYHFGRPLPAHLVPALMTAWVGTR